MKVVIEGNKMTLFLDGKADATTITIGSSEFTSHDLLDCGVLFGMDIQRGSDAPVQAVCTHYFSALQICFDKSPHAARPKEMPTRDAAAEKELTLLSLNR